MEEKKKYVDSVWDQLNVSQSETPDPVVKPVAKKQFAAINLSQYMLSEDSETLL